MGLLFTSLTKSTISCSVVSLVMKLSISVTTSTQMEQVRSFLGVQRQPTMRLVNRRVMIFIVIGYEYFVDLLLM